MDFGAELFDAVGQFFAIGIVGFPGATEGQMTDRPGGVRRGRGERQMEAACGERGAGFV